MRREAGLLRDFVDAGGYPPEFLMGGKRQAALLVLQHLLILSTLSATSYVLLQDLETDSGAEVARHFSPDVTANAVSKQFSRYFNPDGQRIRDHVAAGGNPESLTVLGTPR